MRWIGVGKEGNGSVPVRSGYSPRCAHRAKTDGLFSKTKSFSLARKCKKYLALPNHFLALC